MWDDNAFSVRELREARDIGEVGDVGETCDVGDVRNACDVGVVGEIGAASDGRSSARCSARFPAGALAAAMALAALGGASAVAQDAESDGALESIETALERFTADYGHDVSRLDDQIFGIEVDGAWWTVTTGAAPGEAALSVGAPETPSFYFTLDRDTLEAVDAGELHALTAMAKARSSDVSPMDVEVMEGFEPGEGFLDDLLSIAFHFWTRGAPEIIAFGPDVTREVHGANAAVFYYQPGFRSAWFSVEPGQHANEDPADQVNEFPSLFIVTRGSGSARIGGAELTLSEGQAVFIPPGVAHEFWNDGEAAMEGVLLMFGEGA